MAAWRTRRALRIGVGVLLALLVRPALAETTWICNLTADGEQLYCAMDAEPWITPPPAVDGLHLRSEPRAPTVRALDPRLAYAVALWSPPVERAFVELLAKAALCARDSTCRVLVARSPWLDRPIARATTAPAR